MKESYRLNIEIVAQPAEVFAELNLDVPIVKRLWATISADTKEGCQAGYEVAWSLVMNKRCWIRTMKEPKGERGFESGLMTWTASLRLHFIDEPGPQERVPSDGPPILYMGGLGQS